MHALNPCPRNRVTYILVHTTLLVHAMMAWLRQFRWCKWSVSSKVVVVAGDRGSSCVMWHLHSRYGRAGVQGFKGLLGAPASVARWWNLEIPTPLPTASFTSETLAAEWRRLEGPQAGGFWWLWPLDLNHLQWRPLLHPHRTHQDSTAAV